MFYSQFHFSGFFMCLVICTMQCFQANIRKWSPTHSQILIKYKLNDIPGYRAHEYLLVPFCQNMFFHLRAGAVHLQPLHIGQTCLGK